MAEQAAAEHVVGEAAPPAAEPPAADAAAPPAPDAARGRGAGRHAVRMAWGRGAARAARAEAKLHAAVRVSNPGRADVISKEVFGLHAASLRGGGEESSGVTLDPSQSIVVSKKRQGGRQRRRGAWSHVAATAEALVTRLQDCRTLIHTEVIDDATMWCRKPLGKKDKASTRTAIARRLARTRGAKLKGKVKGKNVAIPVQNITQHAFLQTQTSTAWSAIEIHSPATALPQSNWSTLLDRKRQWSLCTGGQVGRNLVRRVDDGRLQSKMGETKTIAKLCTNDAAKTNDCVVSEDQRALILRRVRDAGAACRFCCHLDIHCQGHQTCLLSRPVYEGLGDYSTCIVRLGHILEGYKNKARLLDCADEVLDGIFRFRRVLRLPEECTEWRADAAWVLQASRAAQDLSAADADALLDHDNGDWRSREYTHWCLGEFLCPLKCKDAADSLAKAKELTRTDLGPGCPVALAYRWKHMDRAQAYMGRGRGRHDLLGQSLRRMWTAQELDEAADALAVGADDVDAIPHQTKIRAKARSVLRCLESDPEARVLMRGVILTQPLQGNLNRVLAADESSSALTILETQALDPAGAEARALECLQRNFAFVSGANGRKIMQSYTEMISNQHDPRWQVSRMRAEDFLEYAFAATSPMVATWFRCVFYFQDARFEVFQACAAGGGRIFNFQEARVRAVLQSLQDDWSCHGCWDEAFAKEVVRILQSSLHDGFLLLRGVLSHLRVGSGIVERRHLLGQELKPAKSRGVAVDARNLAMITYIRSTLQEARLLHEAVENKLLASLA